MGSIWTNTDLASALGAVPIHTGSITEHRGISIDSRTCQSGNVFVCVSGDRTDGHLYIPAALAAGASALIVSETWLAAGTSELPAPGSVTVFAVSTGLEALQDLARFHRTRLDVLNEFLILAVTGSNGKTTCKEMLASMLSSVYPPGTVYATRGNLNNHIGVPLTILDIQLNCRIAILEMGMNHAGEIDFLTRLARPHHAFVSSIAPAHMEFFRDLDAVSMAKFEIIAGLQSGSSGRSPLLYWPADAPCDDQQAIECQKRGIKRVLFADSEKLRASQQLAIDSRGVAFDWRNQRIQNNHYYSAVLAANLNACLSFLADTQVLPVTALFQAASAARPQSHGRFQVHRLTAPARKGPSELLLVDDTYNANSASFLAALDSLRQILPAGRLAVFAGAMAELGPHSAAEHQTVGARMAELDYALVVTCGQTADNYTIGYQQAQVDSHPGSRSVAMHHFQDALSCKQEWMDRGLFDIGQYDGILVKGSRSAKMEVIVKSIQAISNV
ncbi:MAG: UDP-N-acetylmuramoyl-tripeptide--D-alanyl-D-alanine ligase [Leptospiraceae bacterium]|nr:UDP-N-acetylmuramoyl-tripeptide--D-alanyl-D-alanine ligase [Leptospiraceae bacterium]